jgi:hypothetical protein
LSRFFWTYENIFSGFFVVFVLNFAKTRHQHIFHHIFSFLTTIFENSLTTFFLKLASRAEKRPAGCRTPEGSSAAGTARPSSRTAENRFFGANSHHPAEFGRASPFGPSGSFPGRRDPRRH